ncbi:MAG: NAD(P)H-hydrate dehydratase [Firmicutes bacterium]|nr:NAD(P)H-hydrate dehydratase [Bacillota bacterium]
MKVAFAEQMKSIDQAAQTDYGVPGILLMERAALEVLSEIKRYFFDLQGKRIFIFCGKGNNGGDGMALARLLTETDADVTVVLISPREQYQGLARENLERAEKYGVRVIVTPLDGNVSALNEFQQADLIVDAILGTGTTGSPKGAVAAAIEIINRLNKPVFAVDVPSGVDVDNGAVPGTAVKATRTITFGLPKPGLLIFPGAEFTGELIVKSIGFPKQLLESDALSIHFLTASEIRTLLPKRPVTAHKGTTGQVLVIGGSPGMTGALALATLGALRTGAGLVFAGVRPDLPFPEKAPEVIVKYWPSLIGQWDRYRAIVFGPGLSTAGDGRVILADLLSQKENPVVIDADGLNLLAEDLSLLKGNISKPPVVLTPHPGEMSRLTGIPVSDLQNNRLEIAKSFAVKWGVTLVLKGARTVIAASDGRTYINSTGNSGMATAGMGDVLAGIIGSLIAQGRDPVSAAAAGTYLHGLAGDRAAAELGSAGIIASDLLARIPMAIRELSKEAGGHRVGALENLLLP